MFTGIIIATGRIVSAVERQGDLELGIEAASLDLSRIAVGDSISVQGVCLTATRIDGPVFLPTSPAKRCPRPPWERSRSVAASIWSQVSGPGTRSAATW